MEGRYGERKLNSKRDKRKKVKGEVYYGMGREKEGKETNK